MHVATDIRREMFAVQSKAWIFASMRLCQGETDLHQVPFREQEPRGARGTEELHIVRQAVGTTAITTPGRTRAAEQDLGAAAAADEPLRPTAEAHGEGRERSYFYSRYLNADNGYSVCVPPASSVRIQEGPAGSC
jgi:hypothetical protein